MAATQNNPNLELVKWAKGTIAKSFLRNGRFDPYTGDTPNSIIRRVPDLKSDGKYIIVPLLDQLRGNGVGTGQLTGREEGLDNYGQPFWPAWLRDAVTWNKSTAKESAVKVRTEVTPMLANWVRRMRRDDMVQALLAIPTAVEQLGRNTPSNRVNGVKWADATASQKNLWALANNDRVVFGARNINTVPGNVAVSLANISAANDKMSAAVGNLLKTRASLTTVLSNWPAITPYMAEDGTDEEWYVCFMGSRAFRDLVADPVMQSIDINARPREKGDPTKSNPIFTGSYRVYNGVIYREIPEIDALLLQAGAGGGSPACDVSPVFFCGCNALAYVIGQMPRPTHRDETDYQFTTGIGTEMQYGVGKVAKAPLDQVGQIGNLKDWGMVTGFVAAPDNA